jgi:4-alpha-glucanotransferase
MGIASIIERQKASLVLLHPTSLPDPEGRAYGVGELGSEAFRFIDFLVASGTLAWQTLPLGHTGFGDSPYQTFSRFAGSPHLISVEKLFEAGDVSLEQRDQCVAGVCEEAMAPERVNFGYLYRSKIGGSWEDGGAVLRQAYETFARRLERDPRRSDFERFRREHAPRWLDDYAEFMALKELHGGRPWTEWGGAFRDAGAWRNGRERLIQETPRLRRTIEFYAYLQYVFFEQWYALRDYAHERGRVLIGDLPWYVGHDSADVWAHRAVFDLDEEGAPLHVAGVPPDYFSPTGQLWGNPVYRWEHPRAFEWWADAVAFLLTKVDVLRIDHMRAVDTYWQVPYAWAVREKTATKGCWAKGPGRRLLEAIGKRLVETGRIAAENAQLPLIAEDLGFLDPLYAKPDDYPKECGKASRFEVDKRLGEMMQSKDPELGPGFNPKTGEYSTRRGLDALLEECELPWMAVLQFGLEGAGRHAPENLIEECVAYTGTHDNDTALGWYYLVLERADARSVAKRIQGALKKETGQATPTRPLTAEQTRRAMLEIAWKTAAGLVGAPMQDLIGLGSEGRMNFPGDNLRRWWAWRATRDQADYERIAAWLRELNEATGRLA